MSFLLTYGDVGLVHSRRFSPGTTAWRLLGWDGNVYASMSALKAATTPFPYQSNAPERNVFGQHYSLRSVSSTDTDGSPFYVQFNVTDVPTDLSQAFFVSGSGQVLRVPKQLNIAVRMGNATDVLIVTWVL